MLSFLQHERNRRALALLLAAVLVLSPLSALAGTYDIGDGDITVTATLEGEQNVQKVNGAQDDETIVITGTTGGDSPNTLTLNAGAGATVQVTVKDLHIDAIYAAVTATGGGDIVIELDGDSTLTAGYKHAGLQKENGGTLTIQDANNDGSLTANGGRKGAGIGGGYEGDGTGITISGGTVKATGGDNGAGIGGGDSGNGTDITISGGEVTANGGEGGAGIGGGAKYGDDEAGNGTNINITGGTVNATGGKASAGIGGGSWGNGTDITISGDAQVTATGGEASAGIGGGSWGNGTGITIEYGTVTATGGDGGAGIGGGDTGSGTDINITGGTVVATGGSRGAGIGAGGGTDKVGSDITISGGTVVAVSTEVGAGIGGGSSGTAGDITVSGDAQVSVAGGETYIHQYYTKGSGAGIGDGGKQNNDPAGDPIPGQEAAPHTEDLTCGHIYYYIAGTTAEQIQNGDKDPTKTVCGSGHAPCVPVKENEVAGNCTTEGGYDLVTRCQYCNTVLSSEHTNTGIAHTPGEPQKENEIAGDCVTDGGYDLVTYCTACGNELTRQHTNTGKVADAHDWVVDEAVPPTCTETGLTEGKHCSRCPEKVEQQVVPADGHAPGEPVKENVVEARIGAQGSYDQVVYCVTCHAELSRVVVVVPAITPEPEPTPVVVDDPFTAFCKALAHRIRTAPKNGTVAADATPYAGLQRAVFEALAERPDVTLTLTCRVNGRSTELTVPAGTDLLTPLGAEDVMTFETMAKLLG